MSELPRPPRAFQRFTQRFPQAAEAWDLLAKQGSQGPLDPKTQRLAKFAIAIGAHRPGAAHAAVRKALAAGATPAELEQIVALAAATLGLPAAVAAYGWIQDITEPED